MTALTDFIAAQGLTEGAAPADFGVRLPDDPAYEGIVSTPAEAGVDSETRVSVMLFSDNTAVPAEQSPYEPTNANDPVSPQQVSQSAGSEPYAPGILHSFPDEAPPIFPEVPVP